MSSFEKYGALDIGFVENINLFLALRPKFPGYFVALSDKILKFFQPFYSKIESRQKEE